MGKMKEKMGRKKEKESFINDLTAEIQSGWSGKDSTIFDWIKSLKEKQIKCWY